MSVLPTNDVIGDAIDPKLQNPMGTKIYHIIV